MNNLKQKGFRPLLNTEDEDSLIEQSIDGGSAGEAFELQPPGSRLANTHAVIDVNPTISASKASELLDTEQQRRSSMPSDMMDWTPLPRIPTELQQNTESNEGSHNNRDASTIMNPMKRTFYLLLEDPSSSTAAFFVNVFVSVSIVASAAFSTIETIPAWRSAESNAVWFNLETAMVIVFTIEYALRFFAHSDTSKQLMKFVTAPLSIIDLIAIVPYYVELIGHKDTTYEFRFTILRLFRLLRLFRSFKYSNTIVMTIEVMMVALKRSGDALSAIFFFMFTSVVLFSTLLYFAERGVWDETLQAFVTSEGSPSTFDSIPSSFWFVLVTITTTGYGDMVPVTFIGKLIAFPAMMFGILLIALPSIIVGRNFTLVWEAMRQYRTTNRSNRASVSSINFQNSNNVTSPRRRRHGSEDDEDDEDVPRHVTSAAARRRSGTSFESAFSDPPPKSQKPHNNTFHYDDDAINALHQQMRGLMAIATQNQKDIKRILKILEAGNDIEEDGESSRPKGMKIDISSKHNRL